LPLPSLIERLKTGYSRTPKAYLGRGCCDETVVLRGAWLVMRTTVMRRNCFRRQWRKAGTSLRYMVPSWPHTYASVKKVSSIAAGPFKRFSGLSKNSRNDSSKTRVRGDRYWHLSPQRRGIIFVQGKPKRTAAEAEALDSLYEEAVAFAARVERGEAQLTNACVRIVSPDPLQRRAGSLPLRVVSR